MARNLGESERRMGLIDIVNMPVRHFVGPFGKPLNQHGSMFRLFKSDDQICLEQVLLRALEGMSDRLHCLKVASFQLL